MYIRPSGVPNLPMSNLKRGEFLWQNRDLINLINYAACKINPNLVLALRYSKQYVIINYNRKCQLYIINYYY